MRDDGVLRIEHWNVEYGDGSEPESVSVPHAWRQDMPLAHEGPVVYRAAVDVPKSPCKLRFEGASYAAEVSINGRPVATHRGIWDAFDVPLGDYLGTRVEVCVSVVKNGCTTYPVNEVASGFLPYVFHTFGGIHGAVLIVDADDPLEPPAPTGYRVSYSKDLLLIDAKPFYARGLLHWGWYPDLGHTNPPAETIRKEVQQAKRLGFNLVKFCLWVPPHRYLEILREEGMEAWIELPLWDPTHDEAKQDQIASELESIVRQYRRHDNIILWTVGCELSGSASAEFRSRLTQTVRNLAGSLLVKDNSGGAEMYGGDPREFGDFYDFHPYCDTQFYPAVLDSLLPGPRYPKPTLLGEYNDVDVHRDLAGLANEIPFWASNLSELNEKGVRWQYDLPTVLRDNRFAQQPSREGHHELMESSRQKALFIRKTVTEAVRQRRGFSGYVVTGMRDTPISSAGFFDDWDSPRFSEAECATWNGEACLFMIPDRRPRWVHGGNRPGYADCLNRFSGRHCIKIGIQSDKSRRSGLVWRILDAAKAIVAQGAENLFQVDPVRTYEIGQIDWLCNRAGEYTLEVEYGTAHNSWPIWIAEPFTESDHTDWFTDDPMELLGFRSSHGELTLTTRFSNELKPGLMLPTLEGTEPKPFWREAAYEFRSSSFWSDVPFAEQWARLLPVSTDRVLKTSWLDSLGIRYQILMNRIDVRTYEEHAVMARVGETIVTTLRPFGGLGIQPLGIANNPAGLEFIRSVAKTLTR